EIVRTKLEGSPGLLNPGPKDPLTLKNLERLKSSQPGTRVFLCYADQVQVYRVKDGKREPGSFPLTAIGESKTAFLNIAKNTKQYAKCFKDREPAHLEQDIQSAIATSGLRRRNSNHSGGISD
ncbi:MAG: hypothetical protein K2X47_09840, partial [Bdellovibrionales bacterium]|nr:hypothetical protein [Bdellovibrionales bacterium]